MSDERGVVLLVRRKKLQCQSRPVRTNIGNRHSRVNRYVVFAHHVKTSNDRAWKFRKGMRSDLHTRLPNLPADQEMGEGVRTKSVGRNVQTTRIRIATRSARKRHCETFAQLRTTNMDWQEQARLSGLVFLSPSINELTGVQVPHCTSERKKMPSLLNDEARFGHSSVLVRPPNNPRQGMILFLGGQRYSPDRRERREALDSALLWNGENGSWSRGPPMIQGRIDSTVVVCGDSVYAIGGENARGNALNSIERISIKSLLTDYTNANNNRATTAWQTFRCCLSMPRAFANAVSVQDRYIVVAGGRSNAVVGQNRYDRERRVLDSVEIIDTHFPYLSMPFGGPLLNYPRYSFGMGVVQNRIFVVGGQCQYESGRYVYRGHSVEYLDFLPPCLDTTSDPAESEALSSTMMSWQVHGDRRLRDIVCQEVVRVGSCLVFERGVVLDTRRDQIWNFRSIKNKVC